MVWSGRLFGRFQEKTRIEFQQLCLTHFIIWTYMGKCSMLPCCVSSPLYIAITSSDLPFHCSEPSQYSNPPSPTLTARCCPKLHAMQYKYLGENTVQINRCVRRAVHAAMTNATLAAVNTVKSLMWRSYTLPSTPAFLFLTSSTLVAEAQYIGPAQLLIKVSRPTVKTSKSRTPLYADDRSTDEMALVPPKAKKDVYWNRREVVVSSARERSCAARNLY